MMTAQHIAVIRQQYIDDPASVQRTVGMRFYSHILRSNSEQAVVAGFVCASPNAGRRSCNSQQNNIGTAATARRGPGSASIAINAQKHEDSRKKE
eukprot:6176684-Pleurochrysis_carterae.AAC.1